MIFESKWRKKKYWIANKRGFTLLEVLFAAVIIGIGFIAILASVTSSTKISYASSEMTQAIFLSQEIREWTAGLPFHDTDPADLGKPPEPDSYMGEGEPYVDDLDDLMEATFSPPRNGLGEVIVGMADWNQSIILTWRSSADINTVVVPGTSDLIHVQVTISKNNKTLIQTGWLVAEEGGVE